VLVGWVCCANLLGAACSGRETERGGPASAGTGSSASGGVSGGAVAGASGVGATAAGSGAEGGAAGARQSGAGGASGGSTGSGGSSGQAAGVAGGAAGGETAGRGGAAGAGGGVAGAYSRCDPDLGIGNNPACDAGSICGSGYCAPPCENDIIEGLLGRGDDCPAPLSGKPSVGCSVGHCRLGCQNGGTCPTGLICPGDDTPTCWNPDAL
jgi:hypothetical protein